MAVTKLFSRGLECPLSTLNNLEDYEKNFNQNLFLLVTYGKSNPSYLHRFILDQEGIYY